jgi:hypothetical protein
MSAELKPAVSANEERLDEFRALLCSHTVMPRRSAE